MVQLDLPFDTNFMKIGPAISEMSEIKQSSEHVSLEHFYIFGFASDCYTFLGERQ